MKCGESKEFHVSRSEAHFDRACDEAYERALDILGIDDDGHSSKVEDWERSRCGIELEFARYFRVGREHVYRFTLRPTKSGD